MTKLAVILLTVLSLTMIATSAFAYDGTIRPDSRGQEGGSRTIVPLHDGTIRPH